MFLSGTNPFLKTSVFGLCTNYLQIALSLNLQRLNMLKKITVLFGLLLITLLVVKAQNPCAALQIQGPPGNAVPCDDTLILTANITFPVVNNTDTYTGSVIPFTPEPWVGPNTIIANTDDVWSGDSFTFSILLFWSSV